jgi:hypothetical protein
LKFLRESWYVAARVAEVTRLPLAARRMLQALLEREP